MSELRAALDLLARWQSNCLNRRLRGDATPMELFDDTKDFLADNDVTVVWENENKRILTTFGEAAPADETSHADGGTDG